MTAQVPDLVHYEGEGWFLASTSGGELFDPSRYAVRFCPGPSCCWRGFVCEYRIADGQLTLDVLRLFGSNGPLPELFGKQASTCTTPGLHFGVAYIDLGHPLEYTGRLLLACEFISELYVHMGFHPPWKYRRVVEVRLEAGRVLSVDDCSSEMALERERMAKASSSGTGLGALGSSLKKLFSRRS